MFSQIKFGTRFAVACFLLAIPLVCTVYGMMPHSFWVDLFGGSDEAVKKAGSYFYWKNCLSTGSCLLPLILLGALNPKFLKTGSLMMLGLVFSLLGDWFMKQSNLIGGIGFFGLGHICFMLFFFLNGKWRWSAPVGLVVLLAGYLPYFYFCLLPSLGEKAAMMHIPTPLLTGAVAFYLIVSILSVTAALTFGERCWVRVLATVGICCILFSDTLIAENMFNGRDAIYYLMMPTYLATHFLVTAAAVFNFVLYRAAPSPSSNAIV